MQEDVKSISLQASKLSWSDIDKRANDLSFKDRSRYTQYLYEKDYYKSKYDLKSTFMIILLLFLAMVSLMILIKVGV